MWAIIGGWANTISDYLNEPDCLVWVDVCAPDADRLNSLADELSLDPHTAWAAIIAVPDAVLSAGR